MLPISMLGNVEKSNNFALCFFGECFTQFSLCPLRLSKFSKHSSWCATFIYDVWLNLSSLLSHLYSNYLLIFGLIFFDVTDNWDSSFRYLCFKVYAICRYEKIIIKGNMLKYLCCICEDIFLKNC